MWLWFDGDLGGNEDISCPRCAAYVITLHVLAPRLGFFFALDDPR